MTCLLLNHISLELLRVNLRLKLRLLLNCVRVSSDHHGFKNVISDILAHLHVAIVAAVSVVIIHMSLFVNFQVEKEILLGLEVKQTSFPRELHFVLLVVNIASFFHQLQNVGEVYFSSSILIKVFVASILSACFNFFPFGFRLI